MPHPGEMSRAEKFIERVLDFGAIKFVPEGTRLNSGRISPYFFDSGSFSTNWRLLDLAEAYARQIWDMDLSEEVIFGPAYKGIPLAVAVSIAIREGRGFKPGPEVGWAFNRKEPKDHGEGGTIVGATVNKKRVIIVDDVMTTGDSSGKAVEFVRSMGGYPIGCVIAFDRQERSDESSLSAVQQFQETYGIPVRAVATVTDLITFLRKVYEENPRFNAETREMVEKIRAYQEQYGAE